MDKEKTTHFGYQTVQTDEKVKRVKEVFHSVADKYDVMNDLMSLGIHRLWKKLTVELSHIREGQNVLDLAGGSGDLSKLFSQKVGRTGKVILSDINPSMLNVGRDRMIDKGLIQNIDYVLANAEKLPFISNHFDCVCIAFGLRNVTDKARALKSMFEVVKPGGKLLVLEFSHPTLPGLKPLYDWYSFNILPKLGKIIADDEQSYRYLAESIRMHPSQDQLKQMIEVAGFEDCHYYNLSGGIVALHRAYKY